MVVEVRERVDTRARVDIRTPVDQNHPALKGLPVIDISRHKLTKVSGIERRILSHAALRRFPHQVDDKHFRKEIPEYETNIIKLEGEGRNKAVFYLGGTNQTAEYTFHLAAHGADRWDARFPGKVKLTGTVSNEISHSTQKNPYRHASGEVGAHKAIAIFQSITEALKDDPHLGRDESLHVTLVANSGAGRTSVQTALMLRDIAQAHGFNLKIDGLTLAAAGQIDQSPLWLALVAPRAEMLLGEVFGDLYPTPKSMRKLWKEIKDLEASGAPERKINRVKALFEKRKYNYHNPPNLDDEQTERLKYINEQLKKNLDPIRYLLYLEERYRMLSPHILSLRRRGEEAEWGINLLKRGFRTFRYSIGRLSDSIFATIPYEIRQQVDFPVSLFYGTEDKYFPAKRAIPSIAKRVLKDAKKYFNGERKDQLFPNAPYEKEGVGLGVSHDAITLDPEQTVEILGDILAEMWAANGEDIPDEARHHNDLFWEVNMKNVIEKVSR